MSSEQAFGGNLGSQQIKQVPIKGLRGETMSFERYVDLIREEARSEARQLQRKGSTLRQQRLWAESADALASAARLLGREVR